MPKENTMKIGKKILLGFFIFFLVLVAAAAAVPFLFKGKIIEMTKAEINRSVNAKVDFAGVSLSLLRSFPDFSLSLKGLAVVGVDEFEGIQLIGGEVVDIKLDLMSVISATRPVEIKSIRLKKPDLHILVLEDGRANYDIAKPAPVPAEPATAPAADYSGLKIELDDYSISGGKLIYDDRSLEFFVEAHGIDHRGSGNFTIDIYDLDTYTTIEELTVEYSGIPYLVKANATLSAIFNIDQPNSKYTLKDNDLLVNELKIKGDGYVQLLEGDDIGMDLVFNTPQNDFKSFWSMIPYAYIEGYDEVKADGQFTLIGEVKGVYNGEREEYPAFRFESSVTDGNVQYPSMPLSISSINAQIGVNSPSSDFDDLTVDVPRFSMKLGTNPFSASFNLKTPISDPDVKAEAQGVINLAELSQAFPLEGVQQLSGIINADLRIDSRLSVIEQERYEDVRMDGNLQLRQMNYQSEGLPLVKLNNVQMAFTPRHVRLDDFDAMLGKSDVKASGTIDNILAYFSPQKTMKGKLRVRSKLFDASEWMPAEAEAAAASPASSPQPGSATAPTTAPATESPIFDRFDFSLDAEAKKIVYESYTVSDGVARGNIKPNRLTVSQLSGRIGDSDFLAEGVITNLFKYLFEDGVLGGQLALQSNYFNLNQFMDEEPAAATASSGQSAPGSGGSTPGSTGGTAPSSADEGYGVIPIPPNIDMEMTARIGRVVYTNMTLDNVQGRLLIEDEAVILDGMTARGLGGALAMSGSYDTKDIDNPAFSFKYDLQRLDFQQAFSTFNTFQQLAPIGQFMKGTFSSTMIMDGILGSDMMPKLESLTAEGFLETINAIIEGFTPAQSIGNMLNVDYFTEGIRVTNTRNWFEVQNGVLELKEYDAKLKDINMRIGGTYSLANKLNLKIKARVPRKLLEQNAIGAAASTGFGLLQQQASKIGINIKQSEFVNVLVDLTGDIASPKVGLKLLGMDGEEPLAESAKEDIKSKARDQVDAGKQAAQQAAQKAADKAVDSLKTIAGQKVDQAAEDLKAKAAEAAKDKVGGVLDSAAQKKADELLKGAGKEGADKIKENLEKFNPFGKKKKDGN
jgi:hypothetical protein